VRPADTAGDCRPFSRVTELRTCFTIVAECVTISLMDAAPSTADRILAGARRAVAQRGSGKLAMSAVAAEAGVSRPTLYRWFPTKALLLAALTAYEVEQFDAGLRHAVEGRRSDAQRLDAALLYLMSYIDDAMGPDPIGADPAFALQSLADALDPHVVSLTELLGGALDGVPVVASGTLSRAQAAEMFLRVAYSHYLVPHRNTDELLSILRGFSGLTRRPARRMRTNA
jgi:AcrR family transcriptional regulator